MNRKDAIVLLIISILMIAIGVILGLIYDEVPYDLDRAFIGSAVIPLGASIIALANVDLRTYTDEAKEKEMRELNARMKEVPMVRIVMWIIQIGFIVVTFIINLKGVTIESSIVLVILWIIITIAAIMKTSGIRKELKKEIQNKRGCVKTSGE